MECHFVTGGAGFIGSCYVLKARTNGIKVVNLDKLTYAGNLDNLKDLAEDPDYTFVHGGIENEELVAWILKSYQPSVVINFAAESHVDRSIIDPESFVKTNVLGTATLLRVVKDWWKSLSPCEANKLRFLHVSTDEVFGTLGQNDLPFTEMTPYSPNSPYSASKAASDHLVRAFYETYGLPIFLTNCSNNYGPYHFPEKLIPLVILNALDMKPLPIYGKGDQIRDWLFVEDHARALYQVVTEGVVGETYNIGGHNEKQNIEVVKTICKILDELKPQSTGQKYETLITFVKDRPGHDLRYAIDAAKIEKELGWTPQETFETGIRKTVEWYLNNLDWCRRVQDGSYQRERLGVNA